jgi:RNA polymerase sigma-B factor
MAGWHMGSPAGHNHTLHMAVATRYSGRLTENDQIASLIRDYRDRGDRRAIEDILALHGKLLNHLVRRYAGSSDEPYEDLLQVGYVGLIKAVNGYKTDSTAKFSSYAYAMIDGELRHHLRDSQLVKKPRWARSLYARISEATARLTAELGRPPLVEEVGREVNVSPEGLLELMKLFLDTNVLSLDSSDHEDGADVSAIRNLQYESFSLPVEDRIVLESALESLTELQRKVVYLFFYKDLSQTEIGSKLRLPQRKISRVVASALKALRDP